MPLLETYATGRSAPSEGAAETRCKDGRTRVMRESTASGGNRCWHHFLLGVAAAALLVTPVLTTDAVAQGEAAALAPQPGIGQAGPATLRTVAEMEAFDAAHPDLPVAVSPHLPTMDFQQYLLLK